MSVETAIKLIINGKELEAKAGSTVLEAAQSNGIKIPSLCAWQWLAPYGGCRLCLVEIKGKRGFLPACCTYVEDGLEILTETAQLQALRKRTLELILSEHPNACLVCTEKEKCDDYKSTIRKVGEVTGCVLCAKNARCQLQEVVEAVKIDKVRFPSLYRNLDVHKEDPFFDRNYNLCILCGRCVRVCVEVRGAAAISFAYRGPQSVIGTPFDKPLLKSGCQFCGACVDVCPTGALVERAIRPESLPEKTSSTICVLCGVGCEIEAGTKNGKILATSPAEKGSVNEGQGCVKGRFLIRDVVHSPKRILKPMLRKGKGLKEVGWEEALNSVGERLGQFKGEEIAFLVSSHAALEDYYLLQKFAREGLGVRHFVSQAGLAPHALFQKMAGETGISPDLHFQLAEISKAGVICLFCGDLTATHPILWLEIFKSLKKGAKLITIAPQKMAFDRYADVSLSIKPGSELCVLGYLAKSLLGHNSSEGLSESEGYPALKQILDKIEVQQVLKKTRAKEDDLDLASQIIRSQKPAAFIFGPELALQPWGDKNLAALWNLAQLAGGQLVPLSPEVNLSAAFQIDQAFHGHGQGSDIEQINEAVRTGSVKSLYLAGVGLSLENAKPEFLVVQDSYHTEMLNLADAVFPAATFAESEGHLANFEGRIQKFKKVIAPLGEARPEGRIISQLAQRLKLRGFDFHTFSEVLSEIRKRIPALFDGEHNWPKRDKSNSSKGKTTNPAKFIPLEYQHAPLKVSPEFPFRLVPEWNSDFYKSLDLSQEIKGFRLIRDSRWIKLNPEDAKTLEFQEGDAVFISSMESSVRAIVKISDLLPKGVVSARFAWNGGPGGFHSPKISAVRIERESR